MSGAAYESRSQAMSYHAINYVSCFKGNIQCVRIYFLPYHYIDNASQNRVDDEAPLRVAGGLPAVPVTEGLRCEEAREHDLPQDPRYNGWVPVLVGFQIVWNFVMSSNCGENHNTFGQNNSWPFGVFKKILMQSGPHLTFLTRGVANYFPKISNVNFDNYIY